MTMIAGDGALDGAGGRGLMPTHGKKFRAAAAKVDRDPRVPASPRPSSW